MVTLGEYKRISDERLDSREPVLMSADGYDEG
jgi:hypothetical protein